MNRVTSLLRRLAALPCALLAASLAGCPGGGGPPVIVQPLTVSVSGQLEQGAIVTVTVRDGQTVLDPAAVTLSASPAAAAEGVGAGQMRLLATGPVEIRATWNNRTGSQTVQVAAPPGLTMTAEGRRERSAVVRLTVVRDGVPLAPGAFTLTAQPADAAEVLADGRVRLLRAGALELRATAGGREGTLTFQVAVPPLVVFDMVRAGNRDLWRVALDGGDLVRLTEHAAEDRGASVAGSVVVFTSWRHGNGELYSMPLAGGAATRLTTTTASETSVALRPDGQRLAYASDASGVHKLWTANADGSGRQAALPNFGFPGSVDSSPSWAPTGNRLVFMSTAGGTADLYTVTLGGAAPDLLAGGTAAYVDPAWGPAGTHVAFSTTRDGGPAQLYLVNVETKALQRLTNRAGADGEPTWTADGRVVYVAFDGAQSQLRWLDPAVPGESHPIPTDGGSPRRPAGVR
jgi:hypothetical protein